MGPSIRVRVMGTYAGSESQGKWEVFSSSPALVKLRSESIDSTLLKHSSK